ncbi:hypothetical protein HFP72_06685 [Nocardiopsis sp. ARC36]
MFPPSSGAAFCVSAPSVSGQYAAGPEARTNRTSEDCSGDELAFSRRRMPAASIGVYTSLPDRSQRGGHAATSPTNRGISRSPWRTDTLIGVFRPILPWYGLRGFLGEYLPDLLFSTNEHVPGSTSAPSSARPRLMLMSSRT